MIRWNITIPEKTDRAVRTFLARTGGKKGDLSRFVDEAVRKRQKSCLGPMRAGMCSGG